MAAVPQRKRGHDDDNHLTDTNKRAAVSFGGEATLQPVVANHYNNRKDYTREGRAESQILRLRNFNNWVKSCLLGETCYPGCGVFDICSGKGGDLIKYKIARIGYYVAADHADNSVIDSVVRYNGLGEFKGRETPLPFPAKFFTADCHQPFINEYLEPDIFFDVVSCQFALHYSFETEARARGLLHNVASRLKPGGFFVGTITDARVLVDKLRRAPGNSFSNSVFSVDFCLPGQEMEAKTVPLTAKTFDANHPFGNRYIFELKEVIDKCPEYLVPWHTFERIASDVGLELVSKANFHDFFYQHRAKKNYYDLLQKMRVVDSSGGLSADEWDVCGVYMAFTFKKRSNTTPSAVPTVPSSAGMYGKSNRPASMSHTHKIDKDTGIVRVVHTAPASTAPPSTTSSTVDHTTMTASVPSSPQLTASAAP